MSICNCVLPLDISGVLCPFQEFEVLLEPSCPEYLQLGQRPKQNQAKVKDRAKTMFLVDFVIQWIFSYQKHVPKLEKSMDKAYAYELFIFWDHVWTMFGPCSDHVWVMFGPYQSNFWFMLGPCKECLFLGIMSGPWWDHDRPNLASGTERALKFSRLNQNFVRFTSIDLVQ